MPDSSRIKNVVRNSKIALFYSLIVFVVGFISRKVFLDNLGVDVLGLNTTALNLLQFINLAELGISAAVSSMLFRPIFEQDHQAVNEIMSVQGWLYRKVAYLVIAVSGVLFCFFPIIFDHIALPLWYTYATFSVLLFSSLLGYFVNYKQVVLFAAQREYAIVVGYKSVINIAKVLAQIAAIHFFAYGYIWWLVLEMVFAILASMSLNYTIRRHIPYLSTSRCRGRELSKKYPDIITKIKQVFVHRLSIVVLQQSQPLIIFAFTSLAVVGYFSNYLLITTGLMVLVNALFNGMGASVGNLVAQGDKARIVSVFEELYSSRFLLTTVMCIGVYYLSPLFVKVWLGEEYILDNLTLILMLTSFFIMSTRSTVDNYIPAYGLFSDVWAPIAEAILNVSLSVLFGWLWGINGVLLGSIISMVVMILGWKPYFLFTRGIQVSYLRYLRLFLSHILVLAVAILLLSFVDFRLSLDMVSNRYLSLLLCGVYVIGATGLLTYLLLFLISKGMRDFSSRMYKLIAK